MTDRIFWTREHDDALMTLLGLEENLTFAMIAKRMSEQFGLDFKRNGCIGRAHRLRMPPRPPRDPVTHKPMDRMITVRSSIDAPILPIEARRKSNGRDITIYQLGNGDCRWPEGERLSTSYCGQQALDGRPYCAEHCARAYNSPTKRWE
jgi:GcrA cell cycle regulator